MHVSIMMVFHDFGNFEIDFIKNYLVDIINLKKCIEFVVIGGSFEILKRLAANCVC